MHGVGDGGTGPWGLIDVLPATFWLCAPVPTLVLALALTRRRRTLVLAAALVAQTAMLHGVAGAAETVARFPAAWLHAGFTNQIMVTGETMTNLDARFSWPGFFSGAAVFASAVGAEPAALLRWAPLLFALAYLPPLALLFRSLTGSWRVRWMGLWVFTSVNWIGQDYFAPQSFALLLHLIAISVVCAVFLRRRQTDLTLGGIRLHDSMLRGIPAHPSAHQRALLICLLTLIMATLAMSHQLTPFMLIAVLTMLALVGALRPKLLPLVAIVLTFAWISYGAAAYWTGHLDVMFGKAGQVDVVVGSGVEARMIGSDVHRTVINVRMGFTAMVWLLSAGGAVLAWRRRAGGLYLALMAIAPFTMLAFQSYGGEGILRIFLFALPPIALLTARAVHDFARDRRWRVAVVLVAALLTIPTFMVAKYGNESFERVTRGEIETVNALYTLAPPGSTLVTITPNLPWRLHGLTGYDYEPKNLDEFALDRLDVIITMMSGTPKGAYLIITKGQLVYAEQTYGLPPGWGDTLQTQLRRSGRFAVVFATRDGVIYRLVPAPKKRARR